MPFPAAFNTGFRPLLGDNTAAMGDADGDGKSDDTALRFRADDGKRYEVHAQADAATHRWGPGSEVTVTADHPDGAQVLGRYRVSADYTFEPQDVGTTDCRPAPALVPSRRDIGPALRLSSGQEIVLQTGANGSFKGHPTAFSRVVVTTKEGLGKIELASEGSVGTRLAGMAYAAQWDADNRVTETVFMPEDEMPPPPPQPPRKP